MSKNREQLIKLACQGDQQAIEKLLLICQPDIKRFARRTCSTSEDVEDTVQIALWQLYRKIGMLKTVATFTGWLFRIVERECYRLFKIRRSKTINSDFELDNLPATYLFHLLHNCFLFFVQFFCYEAVLLVGFSV
ncbi:RNA polymerase sigma factor [Gilliamella sp. B14448G11]|uniref:RNA polymerase sigma factor n=1 Tax=unclassified Gilliamella TaxID=2685620 RepID=UPI0018DCE78F|nr:MULTISPECIES: RNA polymerase sigma factor [unclassified Gilliamella]MBI0029447.1 RNA polymerase sigma factor [Gilliamella sp. B14448G7]MBI0036389.1 RNA polymerase sigma factor [Gilliamella sp. B14448G11]MBI0043574.1 RNA polymerase sigma factor [Gilliamella sp. B14448G12]